MKKYVINYTYDEEEQRFIAACPEYLGLIIYGDTEEELKRQCLKMLKIFTKNKDLTGSNIDFVERKMIKEATI